LGRTSADYFSVYYEDWADKAAEAYAKINGILREVWGHEMVRHTNVSDGVYEVEYSNGKIVTVNYIAGTADVR
jgi:hypothetical protein